MAKGDMPQVHSKKKHPRLSGLLSILVALLCLMGAATLAVNRQITAQGEAALVYRMTDLSQPLPAEADQRLKALGADCILVLGCGILDRETPTPMLKDRLDTGIKLYREGYAPKILLSGDNGTMEHNEIHVMLTYTLKQGVPREDIFCDHAGFNTSESMHRAVKIFQVESAIIVTQGYHEYRALYDAEAVGIAALGVASDQASYGGQLYRSFREVLARNKDFYKMLLGQDTSLGGEKIPIGGDGTPSQGE